MTSFWIALFLIANAVEATRVIKPHAIEAHMRFLADDLLEGRGTGTRGFDIAARYVAEEFRELGLEPQLQPIDFRTADVAENESSITLSAAAGGQALEYGKDFLLSANYLREESEIDAPLVFAGYGITAPELKHDDYARLDVRGKIVALLSGAPASFPHTQRAHYSAGLTKRETATARGAIGIINVRTPLDEQRASWERVVEQSKHPGQTWIDAAGNPAQFTPQIQATATLSRQGAEKLFAAAGKKLDDVFAKPQGVTLPLRARVRTITKHGSAASPNVLAILRGSDPRLREEYIVYTAHLDHTGITPGIEGDAINNGAYDNASGIAALIEIARAFRTLPEPPRRSIIFLAVTAEERGLRGSDYFAANPVVPISQIVANINMDMFLMLHPFERAVALGAEHSSLGDAVKRAAEELGVLLIPDPTPEEVSFVRSDQYSFVRRGVPAVTLKGGYEPGSEEAARTRQWLRTIYHTPKDDLRQDFRFDAGAKFAQLNFLIGYLVAADDARPKWNEGDFFGSRYSVAGRRSP